MQTEKEYTVGREIHALRCESSGEYSLPDYNGDVKKILLVKSKVFPAGKFVGEDALEFSGTVGYDVVYIDSENTVTHAEFSTDYDAAVRIDADTYVDSDVRSEVAHCNLRLIGPRKLSVKCALDNEVYIVEKRSYTVEGDAFMEYQPEYTSESAMVFTSAFAIGESKEINEVILDIEGAIADEVEILLSDAHTEIDSVEISEGKADLKCRTAVCLLYRNADEQPKRVEKEIVHTEVLDVYDAEDFPVREARVDMLSFKPVVTPAEDGVSLSVSLVLLPKIYARGNKSLEVVTDAYLKERGTENEYAELSYTEHVSTERTEERFETVHSCRELDIGELTDVIYADASAKIDGCEIVDGAVKVNGEIRFSGIAYQTTDDGEVIYCNGRRQALQYGTPRSVHGTVQPPPHRVRNAGCRPLALALETEKCRHRGRHQGAQRGADPRCRGVL